MCSGRCGGGSLYQEVSLKKDRMPAGLSRYTPTLSETEEGDICISVPLLLCQAEYFSLIPKGGVSHCRADKDPGHVIPSKPGHSIFTFPVNAFNSNQSDLLYIAPVPSS